MSFQYSGLIFFKIDWFDLLAVQGTLKRPPAAQFESINSLVLCLLLIPNLFIWCSSKFDYDVTVCSFPLSLTYLNIIDVVNV